MKKIKNIICLDKFSFDNLMESKGWVNNPPKGISCISICGTPKCNEHWFKHQSEQVFNLDIDDMGPTWFEKHESDCYHKSLDLYNENNIKLSNAYFSYCMPPYIVHVLDYEEAFALVKWIDERIKIDDTIYIHCNAGVSRSQGVVRYILDTYGNEYEIFTNPNNPCFTPNIHVVLMLKRACRQLYYYGK